MHIGTSFRGESTSALTGYVSSAVASAVIRSNSSEAGVPTANHLARAADGTISGMRSWSGAMTPVAGLVMIAQQSTTSPSP